MAPVSGLNQSGDQKTELFDSRLKISPDVFFETLEGRAVLLDSKHGLYFELDPVGTRFWELLNQLESPAEVFARMVHQVEVDPETLRADLIELLAQLKNHKLIVPA